MTFRAHSRTKFRKYKYNRQMLCQNFLSLCPLAPTTPLNLTSWFVKPKPNPLPSPKKPTGKRLKVLHASDLHIDPRMFTETAIIERARSSVFCAIIASGYSTSSEANCTSGLCCREHNPNRASPNTVLAPAPRFGAYKWYILGESIKSPL